MNTTTTPRVEGPARDLRPVLTGLGKTIGKNALPVFGCIKVTTAKSGLAELTTTDLDCWSNIRIPEAASKAPGTFLVPLQALRQAIKPAKPGDLIALCPDPNGARIEVVIGDRPTMIDTPSVDDYPSPPAFKGKAQPLPEGARRAIIEASECASTDETRYILNGVYLDTSQEGHHIVGTDGRHLYNANSFALPLAASATLTSHPLLASKAVQNTEPWSIRLARDKTGNGGAYELTAGAWRLLGKLIDGNYPAWRQVVPDRKRFKAGLTVDPEHLDQLTASIKALKIAPSGKHRPVTLRSEGSEIVILWRDAESGKAEAQPIGDIKAVGKPFTVQLEQAFLSKALGFGLGHLQIGDETDPGPFSGKGGRQMVAMPLRMTDRTAPPPLRASPNKPEPTAPMPPKPPRPNKTTPTPPAAETGCPLDAALAELTKVRSTLRDAASSLQSAAAKLKQAKGQQRATHREVRQVRSTLESLRKVRL